MIIAQSQVDGAKTLMSQTLPAVEGPVKYVHTYLNMCVALVYFCMSLRTDVCVAGRGTSSRSRTALPCRPALLRWDTLSLAVLRKSRYMLYADCQLNWLLI